MIRRCASEFLPLTRLGECRRPRVAAVAVAVVIAIAPFTVGAQDDSRDTVIREADKTVYKKKTVIDFSDVTIQGELTKPEGSYLLNRKKTKFKMLLQPRADFLQELYNSTDNL